MFLPLVVDNFAGGGGASTGIEAALEQPIDIAINHDGEAVAMHEVNHPATLHHCKSIWSVDPWQAIQQAMAARGDSFDDVVDYLCKLIWFSPDCKDHSKAKGGKPREKNIRDLAWVVVDWICELQDHWERMGRDPLKAIAGIMLENVEEFRKWAPLDEVTKLPIKARQGETFNKFVRTIRQRGGKVEFKELKAFEYGAPTIRKRLYMIVRFDGKKIVWPKPTHGKPDDPRVLSGKLKPWRTAAECIDWTIPCPSIFDRKVELKPATLRRIATGTVRYVIDAANPFIVPVTNTGWNPNRVVDAEKPMPTTTTSKGGEFAAVDAEIVEVPHLTKFRTGSVGSDMQHPFPTVTANGTPARPAGNQPIALASASLIATDFTNTRASRAFPPEEPLRTQAAQESHAVTAASMVQLGYGERKGQAPRAIDVKKPLGTIVAASGKHGLVTTFLSQFRGSNKTASGGDVEQPLRALTAEGKHQAVIAAHIEQANTGMVGHDARKPLSTIVEKGCTQRIIETTLLEEGDLDPDTMAKATRTAAFLVKYYGAAEHGQDVEEPLHSVTTLARFAVVTVTIDAVTYVIVDIGMRMLTPRELARAQGFPDSYILDPVGPSGRPLSKAAQIRMIGNSVCPDVAEALVRANFPDMANDETEMRKAA